MLDPNAKIEVNLHFELLLAPPDSLKPPGSAALAGTGQKGCASGWQLGRGAAEPLVSRERAWFAVTS